MKTAIRTDKIAIDLVVPDGIQWITSTMQKVKLNGDNTINAIAPREDMMHRKVQDVAFEMIEFTDPITGMTGHMSVAGIGTAIKSIFIKWMLEDNEGSYFDPESGMVIIDG